MKTITVSFCQDKEGEIPIYSLRPIELNDNLASTTIMGIRGEIDCILSHSGDEPIKIPLEFGSIKLNFILPEDNADYGVNPSILKRISKCITEAFKVKK